MIQSFTFRQKIILPLLIIPPIIQIIQIWPVDIQIKICKFTMEEKKMDGKMANALDVVNLLLCVRAQEI